MGIGAAAVGFTLTTAALPEWVPAGPDVFSGMPDASWRFEARGAAEADLRDGGMDLRGGCAGCRGTASTVVDLGEAGGWLVVGEVSLSSPVERARLFLAATCDTGDRWFAEPVRVAEPDVTLVVPEPLAGCAASVGAFVVGDGVLDVGRVRVAPARRSVVWTASYGAAVVAFGVAGAVASQRLWRGMAVGTRVLAVALGVLVIVGVGLPGARLDALLLSIPGVEAADLGVDLWVRPTLPGVLQKLCGHGLAFAALGWFGRRSGAPGGVVMARCFGFAVATEVLQMLVPDRSGRWEDVVLDSLAAAVGIAVAARK
jgi:hypothetical protein